MSGMLFVLLTGLTMFGVAILGEGVAEPETDELPEDEAEVASGGSNPLDEVVSASETEGDGTTEESAGADSAENSGDSSTDATDSTGNTGGTSTDGTDSAGDTDDTSTDGTDSTENSSISGSAQGDVINGTSDNDSISGLEGDDTLLGGLGGDVIKGDEGSDKLYGGLQTGGDDGAADWLIGGSGDDEIFLENRDIATGGEGSDSFFRSITMTDRALITDFNASEDSIVLEYRGSTLPTLENQTIEAGGVVLEFSDGSSIVLAGVSEAIDPGRISYFHTFA